MARGLMVGEEKKVKPKYMTMWKEHRSKTRTYAEFMKWIKGKKKKKGK